MFRKEKPISLKSSTSFLCNNLSVFINSDRGSLNYAVVHKYLVNIVSSTTDGSQVTNRQVVCKEPSATQQGNTMIMQVQEKKNTKKSIGCGCMGALAGID